MKVYSREFKPNDINLLNGVSSATSWTRPNALASYNRKAISRYLDTALSFLLAQGVGVGVGPLGEK